MTEVSFHLFPLISSRMMTTISLNAKYQSYKNDYENYSTVSSPLCTFLKQTLLFLGFHFSKQNSGLENMTLPINIHDYIFYEAIKIDIVFVHIIPIFKI